MRAGHSTTTLRRRPAMWLGSCFGRILVAVDRSRLPTQLPNARALTGGRGKGSRGHRSRFGRFDRSCSWIVLIAEVDERRLACHRTVSGLASPPKGAEGRTGVGSRNAVAKPRAGGGFPVKSAQAGGGSTRRWKAPWPVEAVVFDETAAEAGLASGETGEAKAELGMPVRRKPGRRSPGATWASEATSPARRAGENTAAGGYRRRGRRSRHPPGPSGISFAPYQGYYPGYRVATRWASRAEAGGSPSSDAPPR